MKNNTLKTLGIMVLSAAVLVAVLVGRGKGQTADVPATEVVGDVVAAEVVEETEIVEAATEEVTEETEVVEETEVAEATEVAEEPAYTITEMNATKYAKSSVNVRDLPNTDGNRVGGLSTNQQVKVTGQCVETGWYQIELNGTVAYVSDSYLVDQKVAVTSTPSASTGNTSASTSTSTGTATDNATSTQNQSAASGTTTTQTQTPSQNTATQSQPATTPDTSTPEQTPSQDVTSEQTPVADTNTNAGSTGDATLDSIYQTNQEFSNSGTVISGEQADWAIQNGILDNGGILNPDGSITLP